MSYWEMLFGGLDQAKQNPEYHNLIELLGTSYDESLAQAESIGQGMRDAMTSAFADGKISEEEYQNILNYMQSYNEAMAQAELEAQNQQDYIDQQKLLHKARRPRRGRTPRAGHERGIFEGHPHTDGSVRLTNEQNFPKGSHCRTACGNGSLSAYTLLHKSFAC